MAERKSKPRKVKVEEEERYNWWQLSMYLVAGLAIIQVMVMVSMFLSGSDGGPPVLLYVSFGATAVVAGLFWVAGRMADRKSA